MNNTDMTGKGIAVKSLEQSCLVDSVQRLLEPHWYSSHASEGRRLVPNEAARQQISEKREEDNRYQIREKTRREKKTTDFR